MLEGLGSIMVPASTVMTLPDHGVAMSAFVQDLAQTSKQSVFLNGVMHVQARSSTLGYIMNLRLPLSSVTTLDGLGGLRDTQVLSLDLSYSTAAKLVMHVGMCLKNPSRISVPWLGPLNFDIFYNGAHMGNLSTQNGLPVVTNAASHDACRDLGRSGYNFLNLTGGLHPTNSSSGDGLMSCYLSGEQCEVVARARHLQGASAATSRTIFSHALDNLDLLARFVKSRPKPVVKGLQIEHMMLTPITDNEVGINFTANVGIQSPLGRSPLEVLTVALSADLERSGGEVIGHLTTSATTVSSPNMLEGFGSIMVPASTVMTMPDHGVAMSAFVQNLAQTSKQNVSLNGVMHVQARSNALGYIMNLRLPLSSATVLDGFGGLRDTQVLGLDLSNSTATKPVMKVGMCLKNPSRISVLWLGVLNFDIFYAGAYMGNMSTQDGLPVVTNDASHDACRDLGQSGYNFLDLTGELHPTNSSSADGLMSCYLAGEACEVVARAQNLQGESASNTSTIFSHALDSLDIVARFVQCPPKPVVKRLQMKQLTLTPNTDDELSINFTANVDIQSPLGGSPLEVLTVALSADLQSSENEVIGHLKSAATTVPAPNVLERLGSIVIPASAIMALPDQGVAMSTFVADLVQTARQNISLNGVMHVKARSSALGYVMNLRLPLVSAATLDGFDSFRGSEIRVTGLDVMDGFTGGLHLSIDFELPNPTNIGVSMGPVTAQLWVGGVQIGTISVPNLALHPNKTASFQNVTAKYTPPTTTNATTTSTQAQGVQHEGRDCWIDCGGKAGICSWCGTGMCCHSSGRFASDPVECEGAAHNYGGIHACVPQNVAGQDFVSNYVNGILQNIDVQGPADGSGTETDLFKPAIASLALTGSLPGLSAGLLQKAMILNPGVLSLNQVPTSVVVQNPFSTSLTVRGMYVLVFACEEYQWGDQNGPACLKYYEDALGNVDQSGLVNVIPAKSQATMPYYTMWVYDVFQHGSIDTILKSQDAGGMVKVSGFVDVTIGQFTTRLSISQKGVDVCSAGNAYFSPSDATC
jgi:hypothetical protein